MDMYQNEATSETLVKPSLTILINFLSADAETPEYTVIPERNLL